MDLRARFPLASLAPDRVSSPYWLGHVPFAAELVRRLRPGVLVELGTFSGTSLGAFCQAVKASGLSTRCFGVDHWRGDLHMGEFAESIFEETSSYFATRHPLVASLVRSSFSDALSLFDDGSVDLLHIDGEHTLEAVRSDFESWHCKVSSRGVVLLHDTHVTRAMFGEKADEYGVGEFFDSKKGAYRHAEFTHSYGLGVLCVGAHVPEEAIELIDSLSDPRVRRFFENMGEDLAWRVSLRHPPTLAQKARRSLRRIAKRITDRRPAARASPRSD